MKVTKISDTGSEEQLEIINNSTQLSKDYKYKIEFTENFQIFEVGIKKRERKIYFFEIIFIIIIS